jgi:hypothetical protein
MDATNTRGCINNARRPVRNPFRINTYGKADR